jgi:hypothetical protein
MILMSKSAESIEDFSVKWCRRENAIVMHLIHGNIIHLILLNHVSNFIMEMNIFYYLNLDLLYDLRLRKDILAFQFNLVLAPADKAANVIIIV